MKNILKFCLLKILSRVLGVNQLDQLLRRDLWSSISFWYAFKFAFVAYYKWVYCLPWVFSLKFFVLNRLLIVVFDIMCGLRQVKRCPHISGIWEMLRLRSWSVYPNNLVEAFVVQWCIFLVSIDSISAQQRPWSDCMEVQTDLGICCQHVPKDFFSFGMSMMSILKWLNIYHSYRLGRFERDDMLTLVMLNKLKCHAHF